MTEHLITTPARLTSCPRCKNPVFAATEGGIDVRTDTKPLTVNEEIAALVTGKPTFDVCLHGIPRRMYFHCRDIHRIRGTRVHPVITVHVCPLLFSQSLVPDIELVFPYSMPLPDEPPF